MSKPVDQIPPSIPPVKSTCHSTLCHALTSLACAIVLGAGAALVAYLAAHVSIAWTVAIGGGTAAITGLITYAVLHSYFATTQPSVKTPTPKASTPVNPSLAKQSEPSSSENCIEVVHPYPGDIRQAEKQSIQMSTQYKHQLLFTFAGHPKFDISVRQEDLFKSGAEVIVNAANTHLGGGGGIDGAIHEQGGAAYADLHAELKEKYKSRYTEGFAAAIPSGELKEKYGIQEVIVVAGPQGATEAKKEAALYSSYFNSLVLAHQRGKKRIAFPAISVGLFGFPKERAAAISLRAIRDFITTYPDSHLTIISIHYLKPEIGQSYQNLFATPSS